MGTLRYDFKGPYARYLNEFIEYRQSLGFQIGDYKLWLAHFDRMTIDNKNVTIGITKELFDAWVTYNPIESVATTRGRVTVLNGLSSYLQLVGIESYIGPMPKGRSQYNPHIFTHQEIAAFFHECDRLQMHPKQRNHSIIPALPCIFRILYGTGARVGEVMRLTNEDVNLEQGLLTLKNTKNGVDRIVPLSLSLKEICRDYLAYKNAIGLECNLADKFFSPSAKDGYARDTVYVHFRIIINRAGISHGGRGLGPRIHDFRHTFAVRSLLKMNEEGIDYYTALPILMTYLGHTSIESTAYYLHLIKEMYPALIKKMETSYNRIFTQIDYESINLNYDETDD